MILIRISSLTDSIPPTSLKVRLGRSTSIVEPWAGSDHADRSRPSTTSLVSVVEFGSGVVA